jgi:hypothetical protein
MINPSAPGLGARRPVKLRCEKPPPGWWWWGGRVIGALPRGGAATRQAVVRYASPPGGNDRVPPRTPGARIPAPAAAQRRCCTI